MKRFAYLSVILSGLIVGCGPRYVGGSFGSYANPDRETSTVVATQRDLNGQLLFVIAWTAKNGGGSVSSSDRNLLTHIHGRPVHPSLDERAIYALQSDGGLQKIALTDEQMTALFREMETAGFHTAHSEFWQKVVAPHLIIVEEKNGS